MKVTKYPASLINVNITGTVTSVLAVSASQRPYTLVSETQLTVGVAPVVIAAPPVTATYTFLVINRSGAGQVLRTGFAPAFAAPNVGISVLANEVVIYENVSFPVSVVASAAGALADVTVLSQAL